MINVQSEPILMKSKKRVQEHGEVFTPGWVIDKMTAIPEINEKIEDVYATFLEPSAGEGAFLLAIENLKFQFIEEKYNKDLWDTYALWALTSLYGIEYLEDNLSIARRNMFDLFLRYYEKIYNASLSVKSDLYKSAQTIIRANVIQGNTLTHRNNYGEEIIFSNWVQVPDDIYKVHRIPFAYSSLFSDKSDGNKIVYIQESLFDVFEQVEYTIPLSGYAVVNINQVWKEEKENV